MQIYNISSPKDANALGEATLGGSSAACFLSYGHLNSSGTPLPRTPAPDDFQSGASWNMSAKKTNATKSTKSVNEWLASSD
jgi:hypothetical protein